MELNSSYNLEPQQEEQQQQQIESEQSKNGISNIGNFNVAKKYPNSNGNGGGGQQGRYRKTSKCSHCCADSNPNSQGSCPLCRKKLDEEEPHLRAIKVEPSSSNVDGNQIYNPSSCEHKHNNEMNDSFKKWKYFPGKNKFYCNGRFMTAPSIRFCLLCFALIVVTFGLFIIFDGSYLGERYSIAIPIVGCILFLSVIVNMIKTSFSDPGILPRASQQESEYMEKLYATNNQTRPPPRTKDIIVNGQTMKSKYCFTCKMFRPPRASHCGVCDNCVDRFDHHCPFLGNCIGKRNYRSFYAFVISLSFLSVFVLSCSVAHLVVVSKEKGNFLEALKESPTSAVVVIISFFGMWTVLGLAGFHTYLIAVEQTTNEDIKGIFGRSATKNPFSRGNFCQNCCFVLCGPVQPSLIDPRGEATEDFVASLPKKFDSNGTPAPYKCSNLQASIKTGPHCAEASSGNGNTDGAQKVHQQQPLMQQQFQQPYPVQEYQVQEQISPHHQPLPLERERTLSSIADVEKDLSLPLTNRSLGEIASESLKNLYYSSIEEDPDEHNTSTTITITPEPAPLHARSRKPLIQSYNGNGNDIHNYNKYANGGLNGYGNGLALAHNPGIIRTGEDQQDEDDFDDPTVIQTVSASLDHIYYDDMDDPIPASISTSGRNRKSTGKNKHHSSTQVKSNSNSSIISVNIPSSSSVSERSSVSSMKIRNAGNLKKVSGPTGNGSTEFQQNNKALSSSSSIKQKRNGSGTSAKMSNSTMIDSPLHLDPIL